MITQEDRVKLVRLAIADKPWLEYGEIGSRGDPDKALRRLQQRFPTLRFIHFDMNGADDVLKYKKWEDLERSSSRMIAMGRPGLTEQMHAALQQARVPQRNCMLGPELQDVSSTAANKACMDNDMDSALRMLHKDVAAWLLRFYGHDGLGIEMRSER